MSAHGDGLIGYGVRCPVGMRSMKHAHEMGTRVDCPWCRQCAKPEAETEWKKLVSNDG